MWKSLMLFCLYWSFFLVYLCVLRNGVVLSKVYWLSLRLGLWIFSERYRDIECRVFLSSILKCVSIMLLSVCVYKCSVIGKYVTSRGKCSCLLILKIFRKCMCVNFAVSNIGVARYENLSWNRYQLRFQAIKQFSWLDSPDLLFST